MTKDWVRSLRTVARLPRTAVVHVHLSYNGSFLREGAVLVFARACGLRTIANLHGSYFVQFSNRHPHLTRSVLLSADHVAALSTATIDRVRELVPEAAASRMMNPVSVPSDCQPASATKPIVLFAGEIGHRKGFDVLLAAWPSVIRQVPTAVAIAAGPIATRPASRPHGFDIRHPLPHRELLELIAESRVVVLPSRAEALPMILLEANAHQRPFVATPVGSVPEIAAGGGGTLVPNDDPDALATALVELLDDPALADAMGRSGQLACDATYGVEAVDRQYRSVYSSWSDAPRESRPQRRQRVARGIFARVGRWGRRRA